MGIELDWQVEAEQTRQRDQEDPESKRRRRRARFRLVFTAIMVAAMVCVGVVVLVWRLRSVDQRNEDNLRAAVETELTAIRIGDANAFMQVQRSASDPWVQSQRSSFDEYQVLKQAGRLSADSSITNVLISEERARVTVQEVIDGVPYEQVWFYWQYDTLGDEDLQAGWRHVPPDVTFWGDETTIENAHSSVTYYDLDEATATVLAAKVEDWWQTGCTLLNCPASPEKLEVIIDPQAGVRLAWEPDDGWRLRIVSPLLNGRIAVNNPLPDGLEREIARSIAQRLLVFASGERLHFTDDESLIAFDSTWLKYQLRDWLVANFRDQTAPFLDSAVQVFGNQVPGQLTQTLSDGGQQINILAPALNPAATTLIDIPIEQLGSVDWRPFFEWRLALERQRLQSSDMDNFFTLYESGNFNDTAQARAVDPTYRSTPAERVEDVSFTYRADGTVVALVDMVDAYGNATQSSFAWTGDTFQRVN